MPLPTAKMVDTIYNQATIQLASQAIPPVYNGHHERYADYSHGVRLIAKVAYINGVAMPID